MDKIESIAPDSKKFTFRKYFLALNRHAQPKEYSLLLDPAKKKDFELFYDWAQKNGAKWKWVDYPVYYKNKAGFEYPGMITTHDIECNQDFIYIPSALSLTSGKAWLSELQPFFIKNPTLYRDNKSFEENMVITFILHEQSKKEKSFWYPMFRIWPQDVGLAEFMEESDLERFEDKYFIEHAIKCRKNAVTTFNMLKEAAAKYPDYLDPYCLDWKNYKCAVECLFSRCFNNNADQFNISPLAEFINHENVHSHYYVTKPATVYVIEPFNNGEDSSGVDSDIEVHSHSHDDSSDNEGSNISDFNKFISKVHDADDGEIRIATYNDTVKKGIQPFITYKKGSNNKLLESYGFILENNIYDHYDIAIKDILEGRKLSGDIMNNMNIINDGIDSFVQVHLCRFANNLHTLSKIATDEDKIEEYEHFTTFKSHFIEIAALKHSIGVCTDMLKQFKTSYEDDEKMIESKSVKSYPEYCAIVYKKEKKKILLSQIELLKYCVCMLKAMSKKEKKKDAMREANKELGISEFTSKLYYRACKKYFDDISL